MELTVPPTGAGLMVREYETGTKVAVIVWFSNRKTRATFGSSESTSNLAATSLAQLTVVPAVGCAVRTMGLERGKLNGGPEAGTDWSNKAEQALPGQ